MNYFEDDCDFDSSDEEDDGEESEEQKANSLERKLDESKQEIWLNRFGIRYVVDARQALLYIEQADKIVGIVYNKNQKPSIMTEKISQINIKKLTRTFQHNRLREQIAWYKGSQPSNPDLASVKDFMMHTQIHFFLRSYTNAQRHIDIATTATVLFASEMW